MGSGGASSNTTYAASVNGQTGGFKTPSPEQTPQSLSRDGRPLNAQSTQSSPYGTQDGYGFNPVGYNSMNQMQSYTDVHPSHMSAATHAPASAPPSGLSHYAYPQQSSMMQQPQHQYGPTPPGYPQYGYPNGVPSQIPASSSMNNAMVPSTLQLPGKSRYCYPAYTSTHKHSHVFWCACVIPTRLAKLPNTHFRSHWSNRTTWNEAPRDCNAMGRRR